MEDMLMKRTVKTVISIEFTGEELTALLLILDDYRLMLNNGGGADSTDEYRQRLLATIKELNGRS
jgi:hypothetical protein